MQSTGSRTRIAYVPELTWGTTPTTPQLNAIPFSSFGVNLNKAVFEDDTVQPDRMVRYSVHGNQSVGGSFSVNYAATDFDPFLESLMYSTFTTDVLKTGSTQKSFTIEQASLDVEQYSVYTGCVVSSMTLDVPLEGMCRSTFNVLGKGLTMSTLALDAVIPAPTNSQPFYHGIGSFKEGGTTSGVITSINLTVDNGSQINFALGSTTPISITPGLQSVTGTMQVYFNNATMANKFLSGSNSAIEFTLTDSVKSHKFTIPKVKYNGATREISGQQPITISLPFVGQFDAATSTNLTITRI